MWRLLGFNKSKSQRTITRSNSASSRSLDLEAGVGSDRTMLESDNGSFYSVKSDAMSRLASNLPASTDLSTSIGTNSASSDSGSVAVEIAHLYEDELNSLVVARPEYRLHGLDYPIVKLASLMPRINEITAGQVLTTCVSLFELISAAAMGNAHPGIHVAFTGIATAITFSAQTKHIFDNLNRLQNLQLKFLEAICTNIRDVTSIDPSFEWHGSKTSQQADIERIKNTLLKGHSVTIVIDDNVKFSLDPVGYLNYTSAGVAGLCLSSMFISGYIFQYYNVPAPASAFDYKYWSEVNTFLVAANVPSSTFASSLEHWHNGQELVMFKSAKYVLDKYFQENTPIYEIPQNLIAYVTAYLRVEDRNANDKVIFASFQQDPNLKVQANHRIRSLTSIRDQVISTFETESDTDGKSSRAALLC